MSRKIKRNQQRREKKRLDKEIKQKMNMFDKISDACLACESPFDNKDKDMVTSWYVVVREEKVNLYCPRCWDTAQEIIEELKNGQASTKDNV